MALVTDPIDWELDNNGDLIIPLRYITGVPAVAQGCRIAMKSIRGEWFLNLDHGLPWLPNDSVDDDEVILGGKFDKDRIYAEIRVALFLVPNVEEILVLSVDFDGSTRRLFITWAVRTAFGDTSPETLEL